VRRPDDRAVSTTVGYALTLGVAALLITGLLIAGGGFLEDQREVTTETQLEVIGEQVSADISSADRLSASDADEVKITRNLPDSVTGSQYTISVRTSPQTHLELRSVDPEVTVRVDVAVQEASLVATDIGGGNIQVSYNRTSDELVLRNADA
jgi:hypothetical protein